MDIKQTFMNVDFVKKFLLITILLSGIGILFDFLGFLMISALQWISGILILIVFGLLLVFIGIIHLNVKSDNESGKKIVILSYILLLLISFSPLLIGLSGMLTNWIYLYVPNTTDGSLIASALSILSLMVVLGFGVGLMLICYLKLDDRSIWNF